MSWQESKPASSDPVSECPSLLTTNAIAFRTSMEKHSFWTDSSGASAGIPRLSSGSFGPGAARAFYDTASNLSISSPSKPYAGRLYIASDTSRWYGFTSDATIPLGSTRAIVYLTPTAVSNMRVLTQLGSATVSGSLTTIAFTTTYSGPAVVQVTSLSSSVASICQPSVVTSGTTNFSAIVRNVWAAGTVNTTVLWRSVGTVVL